MQGLMAGRGKTRGTQRKMAVVGRVLRVEASRTQELSTLTVELEDVHMLELLPEEKR